MNGLMHNKPMVINTTCVLTDSFEFSVEGLLNTKIL